MSVYKNIVITGGTKGIGRFLAEEFLKQGSSVVVCSRSDSDVTHALEELSSFKGKVFGIKVDVTVVDDVRKLVAFSLQSLGSVDVLINTAGVIGEVGDFGGCDISKWKEAVLVNLSRNIGQCLCASRLAAASSGSLEARLLMFHFGSLPEEF